MPQSDLAFYVSDSRLQALELAGSETIVLLCPNFKHIL
jgi:hypothetical protein